MSSTPTVVVRLALQGAGGYIQGFQQVGAATGAAGKNIGAAAAAASGAAASIARYAGIAGKALIVGLGAGLVISARAAIEWEAAFAGVRKTVEGSDADLDRLATSLRELSKEIPVTAVELARIAELGGQMGIASDDIADFTETIAQIGATTSMSTEDASMALGRLATIMGLQSADYERMGSVLVGLGNAYAATEGEISDFSLRIAPTGRLVGMTTDEIMALSTAFTSVGVPAERGGTAVQKVITRIADAARSGSSDLDTFAAVAGMSAEDFAAAWEARPAEAFAAFVEGLWAAKDAGENVFQILRDVKLANERSVQSLLAVSSAQGILTDTLASGNILWEENVVLAEKAAQRFDTTAARMTLARNAVRDMEVAIGEGLLPAIGDLADKVSGFIDWMESWSAATRRTIGMTVAIGAVSLLAYSKIAKAVVSAAKGAKIYTGAIVGLRTAVGALVSIGVGMFLMDFINRHIEAEERIRSFLQALADEREGLENATRDSAEVALKDVLSTEQIEMLLKAGYTIKDLAGFLTDAEHGAKDFVEVFSDVEAVLRSSGDKAWGPMQDGLMILPTLTGLMKEYGIALERDAAIAKGEWLDSMRIAAAEEERRLVGLYGNTEATTDLGRATSQTADEIEKMTEEIEKANDAEMASRDTVYSLIGAMQAVVEAEAAWNEEGGHTLENQIALMQAMDGFTAAAMDVGPDGVDAAIRSLEALRIAGRITAEEFALMKANIEQFSPVVASTMQIAAIATRANAAVVVDAFNNLGRATGVVGGAVASLSLAFESSLEGGILFAQGLQSVAQSIFSLGPAFGFTQAFGPGGWTPISPEAFNILNQLHNLGSSYAGTWADIGSQWGSAAGGGAADALLDKIDAAIREAQDRFSGVTGGISAGMSALRAAKDLTDAEQELSDLRREQARLPRQVARAEDELAAAKERAMAITLEEALAIEQSEEAYHRAQAAFEQGVISAAQLAVYRKAFRDTQAGAVSVDTEEVQTADEMLADLLERQRDLPDEIADAQMRLAEAQLAVVESQMALIEAGREMVAAGPDGVKTFRQLAKAAGLTNAQVQTLLDNYAALATGAYLAAPTPLTTGNVPGAPTPTLPAGWATGPTTGPYDAFFAGLGTTAPNPFGPVGGAVVAPNAEAVYLPPESGAPTQQVTTIGRLVLHINGIFDLTKPRQVERVVDAIERVLIQRGIGGS